MNNLKSSLLALLFIATITTSRAQQNTTPTNGNADIGTTSPTEKREVMGYIEIDSLKSTTTSNVNSNASGLNQLRNVMIDNDGKLILGANKTPSFGSGNGNSPPLGVPSANMTCVGKSISPDAWKVWANYLGTDPTRIELCGYSNMNIENEIKSFHIRSRTALFTGDVTIGGNLNLTSNKVNIGNLQPTGSNANYKLAVDGKMVMKEGIITNINWADFVFDEDYKLKSLEEVELYINKNNHLPDVPTAKEVTENGMNIGEIEALLLQKIEELTLYIIEIKKDNIELRNEVEKIKKQ